MVQLATVESVMLSTSLKIVPLDIIMFIFMHGIIQQQKQYQNIMMRIHNFWRVLN